MNNKTILTSTAILTVAIIGLMIIPTNVNAQPNKNTKEINCDDCTLRFQGKNDVTVKFNAGGGGSGQQGEKGDKGDTGATGAQGEQGIQGIQGEKGDKGDQGEQGIAGTNGTDGKDGISGVSGTNGTVLDDQTVNNLQWMNENIDTIKALVNAWNDGSLGVPEEVITNETGNVTAPPVENQTIPFPIGNITLPENVTGNVPVNMSGNITVPNGNFSGDVNVTLPNITTPIAPQENITQNATLKTFGGSVLEQIFG